MSQGSRFLLVSLLAGLWAESGNAAAFDDELAALCREAFPRADAGGGR